MWLRTYFFQNIGGGDGVAVNSMVAWAKVMMYNIVVGCNSLHIAHDQSIHVTLPSYLMYHLSIKQLTIS